MRFRLAGQAYFGDRAPHFTGQMAWVPTYQHDSKVSLGLHLGFGPLPRVQGANHRDFFLVTDIAILYGYRFPTGRYSVEAGPGVQHWFNTDTDGDALFGSLNVNGIYHFKRECMGFVDGVLLGFSVVFNENTVLEQIKLGIAIH